MTWNIGWSWKSIGKKDEFDEEWSKAYALIFYNYCSSEMRTAVKELPTFEKDIRDDPLELMTAVEKLMVTPVKACYPLATLAETLSGLLNLRQTEDENLVDYYDRFNSK